MVVIAVVSAFIEVVAIVVLTGKLCFDLKYSITRIKQRQEVIWSVDIANSFSTENW